MASFLECRWSSWIGLVRSVREGKVGTVVSDCEYFLDTKMMQQSFLWGVLNDARVDMG